MTERPPSTHEEQPPALEVRSSAPLEQEVVQRLQNIRAELGALTGERNLRPVGVIIADRSTWADTVAAEGIEGKNEYTGSSIEVPVPKEGRPRVLLPGPDVFEPDSGAPYKLAFEAAPLMKTMLAEHFHEVYRAVYLDNMAAHELAHLFQFSEQEMAALKAASRERIHADAKTGERYSEFDELYGKGLGLREFTSVLYGLRTMIEGLLALEDRAVAIGILNGFLDANDVAASSEQLTGYQKRQARRTIAASKALSAGFDQDAIKGLFIACRSDDEALRGDITKKIDEYVDGTTDGTDLLQLVRSLAQPPQPSQR